MNRSILDSEITIIAQGPVSGSVERPLDAVVMSSNLKSLRSTFPGARIVVVTWADEDCSIVPSDFEIFRCQDPGPIHGNLKRQVSSVQAALALVATKYCLKTRTDYEINQRSIVDKFAKLSHLKKIATIDFFSKRPSIRSPYYFHFSDILHFGSTDDIRDLWSMDETSSAKQQVDAFFNAVKPWTMYLEYFRKWRVAMAPEQTLWSTYAKKSFQFKIDHGADTSKAVRKAHSAFLKERVMLFDSVENGVLNRRHASEVKNFRAKSRLLAACDAQASGPLAWVERMAKSALVNLLDCGAIVVRWRKYQRDK